jgi:ABC-type uncharacterized transport system involved in gliding motility auxiliary subunit
MNNNISAENLAKAATLAANIEGLNLQLTEARAVVADLEAKVNPLQTEYDTLMGIDRAKAATRGDGSTGRFNAAHRAAIAAGVKAAWAERKAKAAAAAAATANGTTPGATTDVPANA